MFAVRKIAPPAVREILEALGDRQIVSIRICREPIAEYVNKLVNVLTLGTFNRLKKYYKYDDYFHLSLFVEIADNVLLKIEKNAVVNIVQVNEFPTNCFGCQDVVSYPHKSLNELIDNANIYSHFTLHKNLWLYDPIDNNCQTFVLSLLKGNELGSVKNIEFVKQSVEALVIVPTVGLLKKGTDLAAVFDHILHGTG
jgi:hypothetical protein